MIRLYLAAAAVLAVMAFCGTKLYQSYTAGQNNVITKVNKETDHVEAEWDRIDRRPDDFKRSIERLRNNARSR